MGWLAEVITAYVSRNKLINRGFLIGPYCPIYGIGVVAIVNFLKDFTNNWLALFILAMVLCMTLEYVTSFVMEKLFNARWWDYSTKRFNINGRICLETAIPFGIGGLIIMYVINPFIEKILNSWSESTVIIIGGILFVIFIVDLIISLTVILKIKKVDIRKYKRLFRKDDTEFINKKVREYLIKYSALTRRLMESFPNAKISITKIKDKITKTVQRKS